MLDFGGSCVRYSRLVILSAACAVLASCASGVRHVSSYSYDGQKFGAAKVRLHPLAEAKLASNIKFDPQRLEQTIVRMLQSRRLMDGSAANSVEIEITDIRTRSTFSAVMFGFLAGNDRVEGTVALRAPDGRAVHAFQVSASYALGGFGGGQDDARMNWLYEEFARLTADEIAGGSVTTAVVDPPGQAQTPPTGKAQRMTRAQIATHFTRHPVIDGKTSRQSFTIRIGAGNRLQYECISCRTFAGTGRLKLNGDNVCIKWDFGGQAAFNSPPSGCFQLFQTGSATFALRGTHGEDEITFATATMEQARP